MKSLLATVLERPASSSGQVIVIAALLLVVLIGMTGLAIDVSSAYMTARLERSVADAAALAGAQDLQKPGTRDLPGADEYAAAEDHAMRVLVDSLEATATPSGATCFTSAGCALPGTPYRVAIQTNPSPSCVDCDPLRAVQVTIRQPSFGLFFARVFNQTQWTVSSASVAGIVHARKYGVVTLRPPRPRANGTDQNDKDIDVVGGSKVRVGLADIGTNTNLNMDGLGSGTEVILDPGYNVYYYDPYMKWTAPPPGIQNTSLIQDPLYSIPQRGAAIPAPEIFADLSDAMLTTAECEVEMAKVPTAYKVNSISVALMDPTDVQCFKPGIYEEELTSNQNDEAVLLTPGVYFFDEGMDISSTLIGGYEPGQPGVALVFKPCSSANTCPMKANNSILTALNFGGDYEGTGDRATAAEWNGGHVQTDGDDPILMTLLVEKDPICVVQPTEPSNTCTTSNHTIRLPGNGNLWVSGIQYAPTDNVVVSGNNSGSVGTLGQIISWTITFNGGASLNLEAAVSETNGVLRLDPACSPGVSLCNP
jgi:hypothetical protein